MLPKNLQIRIEESPPPRPEPEVPAEPLDGVIESIMVAKEQGDDDLSEPVEGVYDSIKRRPSQELDNDDDLAELLPEVVEKASPRVEDIFQLQESPKARRPAPCPAPAPTGKKSKLTKTGKVRREYTEEQKQKCRDNLQKAREKRQAKLQKKEKPVDPPKIMTVKEPEPEPEPAPARGPVVIPESKPDPPPQPRPMLSKQDIEESQFRAIERYEQVRKQRKQKKKEDQAIQSERDRVRGVARNHLRPTPNWQGQAGRFSDCF